MQYRNFIAYIYSCLLFTINNCCIIHVLCTVYCIFIFVYEKLLIYILGTAFINWQVIKTSNCTNTLPE